MRNNNMYITMLRYFISTIFLLVVTATFAQDVDSLIVENRDTLQCDTKVDSCKNRRVSPTHTLGQVAIIDTLAIQQKETPDYAEDVFTNKYEDQYHGLTSLPEDKEITYSYATVSSTTYSISVRCALKAYSLIDGGNN